MFTNENPTNGRLAGRENLQDERSKQENHALNPTQSQAKPVMSIRICIDHTKQTKKPAGKIIGSIKNKLGKGGGIVAFDTLCNTIANGGTFTAAFLEGTKEADFIEQWLFIVDVDNANPDSPILTPEKAKAIAVANGLKIAICYHTFSSTDAVPKFRLIFICNEPVTNPEEAKAMTKALLSLFAQADHSCTNLDRIFFGTDKGLLWAEQELFPKQILLSIWEKIKPQTPPQAQNKPIQSTVANGDELKEMYRTFPFLAYLAAKYPHCQQRNEGGKIRLEPHPIYPDDPDDDRGFWYDPKNNTFKCFSSGYSGNIFNFMTEFEGMTPQDTRDEVKRAHGIDPERERKDYKNAKARERRKNKVKNENGSEMSDSIMSEDEFAARGIVEQLGKENIVYCKNRFLLWGGQVWAAVPDEFMKNIITQYCAGNPKLTKSFMHSVLALLEALLFKDINFDAADDCIAVKNGELWLEAGIWVLKPHRRESYRTSYFDVDFMPNVKAERFTQFLREAFAPDTDYPQKMMLVCEAIGYTLLSTTEYEKFFLLIGRGANGKSVLLKVICYLLGNNNYASIQPADFVNKFQKAELLGMAANIVPELPESGTFPSNVIKAIASGESITAEEKYKKPFKFDPYCTLWIATNILPHTTDYSDGLYRRAVVIPFNRVFSEHEQDKTLKYTLKNELSGILNLALEAIRNVKKRGHFTEPPSCIEAKAAWRDENDQARQFIEENCILEDDATIQKMDLFKAYRAWADDNGYGLKLTKIGFSKRMAMKGIIDGRTNKGMCFKGIRLASQFESA